MPYNPMHMNFKELEKFYEIAKNHPDKDDHFNVRFGLRHTPDPVLGTLELVVVRGTPWVWTEEKYDVTDWDSA